MGQSCVRREVEGGGARESRLGAQKFGLCVCTHIYIFSKLVVPDRACGYWGVVEGPIASMQLLEQALPVGLRQQRQHRLGTCRS